MNPYPTRTHVYGYGFPWVRVRVAPKIPGGYPCHSLVANTASWTCRGLVRFPCDLWLPAYCWLLTAIVKSGDVSVCDAGQQEIRRYGFRHCRRGRSRCDNAGFPRICWCLALDIPMWIILCSRRIFLIDSLDNQIRIFFFILFHSNNSFSVMVDKDKAVWGTCAVR